MALWEAADQLLTDRQTAKDQLQALRSGLFTMPKEEWDERMADFVGTSKDVEDFHRKTIPTETALKQLFRNKDLSQETRMKFARNLVEHYAEAHKLPYPRHRALANRAENRTAYAEELLKMLDGKWIWLWLCRWLAEVRQHQLAENKKRDYVPQSAGRRGGRNGNL